MAKINGVEVKSLKEFIGTEGHCMQGNVYVKNKKLGFWSQDAYGGPDRFEFDESILDSICQDYQNGFDDSYEYKQFCSSTDVFMHSVCMLKLMEKEYKKLSREGFPVVVCVSDGYHFNYVAFGAYRLHDPDLLETEKDVIEEQKKSLFPEHTPRIMVFQSLDDFDIIIDSEHPAPEFCCI